LAFSLYFFSMKFQTLKFSKSRVNTVKYMCNFCLDFESLYIMIYCLWKLGFLHTLFFSDFKSFSALNKLIKKKIIIRDVFRVSNNIGSVVRWVKLQLGRIHAVNTHSFAWLETHCFTWLETHVTLIGTPSSSTTLDNTCR
jgi:hypothetical protein